MSFPESGDWRVSRRILFPLCFIFGVVVVALAVSRQPEVLGVKDAVALAGRAWAKNWAGAAAFKGALATHGRAILAAAAMLFAAWRGGGAGLLLLGLAGSPAAVRVSPDASRRAAMVTGTDWPELALSRIGLGFGMWALSVLGLGLCGLLQHSCMLALGLGMVLSGAGGRVPRSAGGRVPRSAGRPRWLAVLAMALLATDLLACLSPEWFYDGQVYHLGLPECFLRDHKFAPQPAHLLTFLPLNTEMNYTVALAFGGEEAAKLLNWCWGVMLPLAAWLLVRQCDRGVCGAGAAAALLVASMPVTQVENEIAFSDNMRALFETLALVWVLRFSRQGHRALAMSALFAGLAMGSKYLSVVRGALIAAGLVAMAGLHPGRADRSRRFANAGKFVILASLAFLPWLARNWLVGRDPVYPFGLNVFGSFRYTAGEFTRWMQDNAYYGVRNLTIGKWLTIPFRVSVSRSDDDFGTFTIGPLLLALGALVLGRRRWPVPAGLILAVCLAEAVVWSLTSHLIRYLLPALVGFCAGGAWLAGKAGAASPRFARLFAALFALWACCALMIRVHHRYNVDDIYGIYGYALGRLNAASMQESRGYGAEYRKLPPGPVLLVGEDRVLGAGRRWRGTCDKNVPLLKQWAGESADPRRFEVKIRQAGIRAVLLNTDGFKAVDDRGPSFRLDGRELGVLNPWWKRLTVVYRNPPWIGYAAPGVAWRGGYNSTGEIK